MFPLNKKQRIKLASLAKKAAQDPLTGLALGALGNLGSLIFGKDQYSLSGAIPYLISKRFIPITQRVRLPDTVLQSAASSFGSELGKALAGSVSGLAGSMVGLPSAIVSGDIVKELMKEDDIIGKAKESLLRSAYETMKKVAPTLAKDKNAVRSFLREVALSGTGPDYNTIKALADAEKTLKLSR